MRTGWSSTRSPPAPTSTWASSSSAGFKQRDLGIKQFKKALEIEPTINLTKALVTPELTDAFNEAKAEGKTDGKPGQRGAAPSTPPPAEPAEPPSEAPATAPPPAATAAPAAESSGAGLTHEQVTEAKQGSAISITVGVSPDLKFDKVCSPTAPKGRRSSWGGR